MDQLIIQCPHCQEFIIILEINCGIFRHAIFKTNEQQIDPHTPKNVCDKYIQDNLIYGCGKPFQIISKDGIFITQICEYI